jgi:hypothetical protein
MLRVVGVVIVLVIFVYALVDVIRTDQPPNTRDLQTRVDHCDDRPAAAGRSPLVHFWPALRQTHGHNPSAASPRRPDDDPEFLRNLETRRRHQAEDDRLEEAQSRPGSEGTRVLTSKPADGSGDAKNNGFKPGDAKRSEPDPHDTDELK